MYIKILGIATILVIFFCVGIFFFTRWENQRFVTALPQLPNFDVPSTPAEQRTLTIKEGPEQSYPTAIIEPEVLETPSITPEISDVETEMQAFQETDTAEFDLELDPLSLSTIELPEALPESPVEGIDWVKIKAASQDYNDFLDTDPDYAYDRLTDRFKEMFGDRPEIETLVENIRRSNEGTLTVDDAITMTEASISLLPADETEAIRQLSENLEVFREIKAFQEEGGHVNIEFNISVGGE
ncbi:hypothetical protein F4X10_23760 [Candidatus Poribacteria bacterium]|nr:hypothetical protein [Candidatus Poribacteria bacterium]